MLEVFVRGACQLSIDILRGRFADPAAPPLAVIIHKKHMRALRPPTEKSANNLVAEWAATGGAVREYTAIGWQELLDQVDQDAPLVASRLPYCQCCNIAPSGRAGKVETQTPFSFTELPAATQAAVRAAAQRPVRYRPAFAYGLRVREIFAGTAGWTRACERRGIPADTPVELYDDPLHQKHARAEHDIKIPEVRRRSAGRIEAVQGDNRPFVD